MTSLNELFGKVLMTVLGDSTQFRDGGWLGDCDADFGDNSCIVAAHGTIARLVQSVIDAIGYCGSRKRD